MSSRLRLGRSIAVLGFVVVVSGVVPRAAYAQTTALFVDSQAGDYIGRGIPRTYTRADRVFTAATSDAPGPGLAGTTIRMTTPGVDSTMVLEFQAAGAGLVPGIGTYEAARRAGITPFNGLDVFGFGRRCETLTGRFVVLEAVYDNAGGVLRFAADFEQHCEDSLPALFGAIRYNSTIGSMVPFGGAYPRYRLTLSPPSHGTVSGDGLTCGTGGSQCVANHTSATTARVDATPDAGYVFAGWTSDCTGGPHATVNLNMQRTCSAAFVPLVPVQPRSIAVLTLVRSYANDIVGSVLSPANSQWAVSSYDAGFLLTINPGGLVMDWESFYIRPPTGQSFKAGVEYPTAVAPDATHAGFSAQGYSLGFYSCEAAGTMTVREWVAGPGGLPARFSIDFRSECGPLVGTLQYAGSYEYSQLGVNPRALRFSAFTDAQGVVSHSADQRFQVAQSGPAPVPWELQSDQLWLTGAPATATTAVTGTAKIRHRASVYGTGTNTAHLQPFARGLINIPDPLTVILDVTPADTTSRPFGVFRSATGSWFMPDQAARQFGLPGDIPLSGDFDGDGTPDIAIYRPWTGEWFVQGQPTLQWGWPGDIPVPADYDGDGTTDIAVFRTAPGTTAHWFIRGDTTPREFGVRGDIPVPADYDGDGIADLAVFHPRTSRWTIRKSSNGQESTVAFGLPGDIPVPADFDGDRRADVAVFRPSIGCWFIALSGTSQTILRQFGLPGDVPVPADTTGDGWAELRVWRPALGVWFTYDWTRSSASVLQFGAIGDVPVMARPAFTRARQTDFDADRRADVVVFRPSTGEWFARYSSAEFQSFGAAALGGSSDRRVPGDYDGDRRTDLAIYQIDSGEWHVRMSSTSTERVIQWGLAGDEPVPADYDGDGRTDLAVYRPASGEWFILSSASDFTIARVVQWGLPGDTPAPGDFDGDGRADTAVYRRASGEWFVLASAGGWYLRQGGQPDDVPIAADFDGDGRADLATYRPSTGEWFVLDVLDGTTTLSRQWGLPGDVPVAEDYDGDGSADVAVFRPSTGEWFVVRSSDGSVLRLQWGMPGDVPVTPR